MAFDAYLKIKGGGIEGESSDESHGGWIEVISYSWGVSQPARGLATTGGQAERADFQDFTVVKTVDKASPKLALACCKGLKLDDITLELCRAGGDKEKYMSYKMEDVIVSSVQPSSGADLPTENVSFSYGKFTMTYVELEHGSGRIRGNIQMSWDLKDNVGS